MATIVPRAKKQRTIPDQLIGLAPLSLQGADPLPSPTHHHAMLAHQQNPIPPSSHQQQYPYTTNNAASTSTHNNMSAASGSRPIKPASGFQKVNELIGGKVGPQLAPISFRLLPCLRSLTLPHSLSLSLRRTADPGSLCHRRRYTTAIQPAQRTSRS